ncbi:MAG: hypothetical protein GEU80_00760 [Dehalococcoidia bacterium]|nr:hypothetical protein [Dehalococcoidia bacterium]
MTSMPIYPAPTSLPMWWLAPFNSRWTYSRLLFLVLAPPLGLAFAVPLFVGLVVRGSLAWTIPGVALLTTVVLASRWAGDLDILLVRHLVGIEVRRPPTWYERDLPLREQARQILIDPST